MKQTQRKPSDKVAAAFGQIPAPTAGEAQGTCKDLLGGGAAVINELVELVDQQFGDPGGVKAKYTLHGVVVYAARPGAAADRKMVAEALAAQLEANHSPDLKAFVMRQLQYCGRAEEVAALAHLLAHERLCEPAAQALAAISGAKAAAALRTALEGARGKRRVTIITALGRLQDTGAVEAFRKAAGDSDRDVRLAALYALANAGDLGAADICLKAARVQAPFERSQATDACLLLARRMAARGGRQAGAFLRRLMSARQGKQDVHDRCAVLQALAETTGPKAVGDVMAAMDLKDPACRVPAARTAVDLARSLKAAHSNEAKKLLAKVVEATTEDAVIKQARALQDG